MGIRFSQKGKHRNHYIKLNTNKYFKAQFIVNFAAFKITQSFYHFFFIITEICRYFGHVMLLCVTPWCIKGSHRRLYNNITHLIKLFFNLRHQFPACV